MKIFLCGQYWYKYDSFVNIEDPLLFIHENMQEHVLYNMELCRMWNMIFKVVIFLFIIFIMFVNLKLNPYYED